ncbi:MAG: hypothetical protein IT318_16705 [Anaerolineales bacterium]|nr:hypothetical protein [Anaerolineales bacterium]
MACGYAEYTRTFGARLAACGPAGLRLLGGQDGARLAGRPALAITGHHDRDLIDTRQPQHVSLEQAFAGVVFYMLQTCLGLQPRAFDRQLIVRRPLLPRFVDRVEVTGLWVGAGKAHLRFAREEDVRASAEVVGVEGELDVVIEAER